MNSETETPSDVKLSLYGILFSNVFAVAAFALAFYLSNHGSDTGSGILIFSEFVLVPILMGIIATRYWLRITHSISRLMGLAFMNALIAIGLSAFFMGEGVICLIIVSPLILAFMWVGMLLGKHVFYNDRTTLKATTSLILISIFIFDTFSEHDYRNMVSDEIIINAPASLVWKYVGAHPLNEEQPDYWLFDVGLPYPVQSTATGDFKGAERKCIFSNNAVFDEIVTEYVKDSLYTFDVTKQPADPEIIGHIDIERGQFILKSNPDGTTTLIGNSWYKLNVFPAWYYNFWAEDITRKVHIRVMNHIKRLAENDV